MLKKSKLFIGVLTSMTLVFSSIATAFAEENVVSKTQDNITVTKTAEWTTVDGKSTDASGNRYAKINFNSFIKLVDAVGGYSDLAIMGDWVYILYEQNPHEGGLWLARIPLAEFDQA